LKTNKNISPQIIKAYLAGTFSHAQTHEFEKAMLNDAVLRDMVEGYEISRDEKVDLQKVNASLSKRLKNRVGEEQQEIYPLWKRVPLYARAASVLLFLGIGAYFLMKDIASENAEKMASVQPSDSKIVPQSAPPTTTENEAIAQEKGVVSKQKMKAELDKIHSEKVIVFEQKKVGETNRGGAKPDTIISLADADSKPEKSIELSEKEVVAKSEAPPKPEPTVAYETQSSRAAAPAPVIQKDEVYVKSRAKTTNQNADRPENRNTNIESERRPQRLSNIVILNEDSNKPVPNVSIISEDKTLGKTDEKGRFNLENSLLGNKINLVAPNFENTEIIVNKTTPDLFYIRPKSELIFIDLKRNKTWKYNPAEHPAQPSVSPDEYLEYLQKNLKKPKQAIENQIVGTVEVEFKVNKKGELSDFKITKSLGYGCDEEAIRLIREGPKWLPKTQGGYTGRQRVRQVVNF
jgi:TonB family protein